MTLQWLRPAFDIASAARNANGLALAAVLTAASATSVTLTPGCAASGEDDDGTFSGVGAGQGGSDGSAGSDGHLPPVTAGSAGTGGNGDEQCDQDVDIVFVMDVSTSMGAFLTKLANEISVVDQALAEMGLPNAPHYGLVVFVDDTKIEKGGAPYTSVAELRDDFQTWANFTSQNTQINSGGSNTFYPENSLDALYLAAKSFQWRDSATTLRAVIHTTDDTFWQGPSQNDGVAIQHSYGETLEALVSETIRVFSFAAELGGPFENENVAPGWFKVYGNLPPIPHGTDGAVFKIDDVLSGTSSLADGIKQVILDSYCDPYEPPR
jgi:hypothetical protein